MNYHRALRASHAKEQQTAPLHGPQQVAPLKEENQRQAEHHSEASAHESVEVLVEVDRLEGLQTHGLVVALELGEGLVGLEFLVPLRLVLGVVDAERLPGGHREARLGEPRVAAQAHHEKDAAAGEQQPGAHQPLLARTDVGLLEEEVGVFSEGLGGEEVGVQGGESTE